MSLALTPEEVRVLGALMEKEKATPEYYPLTLNALTNACNQKSSREPVVAYSEDEVAAVIQKLMDRRLVFRVTGYDMRVPRYKEVLAEQLKLSDAEFAVVCVLMLRGAQMPGELRQRTERLFAFPSLTELENTLNGLINREEPLVAVLPRQYGSQNRYIHLFGGMQPAEIQETVAPAAQGTTLPGLYTEIEQLKQETAALRLEVDELKQQFAAFRKQFE